MIKPLNIKGTVFGEGLPKICIPIVASDLEGIKKELALLNDYDFDVAEWRMDFFTAHLDTAAVIEALKTIKASIGDKLLLATFRTDREGGNSAITDENYLALNTTAANNGADIIDVELFSGDLLVNDIINAAHEAGAFVIMSNHDFNATPAEDEIIRRLSRMQELNADIAKIAVMPNTAADVLTLLSATNRMGTIGTAPIISMSMGKLGVISRLCGNVFGSAMTFGAAGKASAPGQINAVKLKEILEILG